MDLLRSSTDDNQLISYAAENILFVEQVSHEWLFSQCSCLIHHGGAGTTVAAIASGTPMIITPIIVDQFDWAHIINNLGIGIGMKKLSKISPHELGDAILRITHDKSGIKRRAASQEIREISHSGVENALKEIEKFIRNQQHGEKL